ncbi:potassium channel family protein [Kitasatospora sp. DSM 101779]|uniref:potassium channel family protein n=1 Tax=Kitasatospora sp. DSM 101779 TaxID=2853165 RepID=UPI0021DA9ADE|nr:potassium channel family protein [Kitasatospora sp. DSM 101779]MCU7826309.1 potassium channel family protein [Kitasatospora sp. DSM 101779]
MTTRRERWERHTQFPLIVLSVLFAVAYAAPVLAPQAPGWVLHGAAWAEWAVWAVFALDYATRLVLAERRWEFVRRSPLDLASVLLPLVQPLRLLRLVSTLLLAGQRVRMASQVRLTTYVAGVVLGLLVFGSLAILEIERSSPNASIRTLGDALWWSFTTMTTVGYGDLTPTTGIGRLLAVALMLSGIALLGVVTANIAAWFVARFEAEDRLDHLNHRAIQDLTAEVRELRRELAELSRPADPAEEPAAGPTGPAERVPSG